MLQDFKSMNVLLVRSLDLSLYYSHIQLISKLSTLERSQEPCTANTAAFSSPELGLHDAAPGNPSLAKPSSMHRCRICWMNLWENLASS